MRSKGHRARDNEIKRSRIIKLWYGHVIMVMSFMSFIVNNNRGSVSQERELNKTECEKVKNE
jgi:hypothetical protein